MKKLISLVFAFILLAFCISCGGGNNLEDDQALSKSEELNSASDNDGAPTQEGTTGEESLAETEEENVDEPADNRGIPGMKATALLLTYDSSFDVPYQIAESTTPDYSAFTCVSSAEVDGIFYDYSISLDEDEEIISGSFGVSSPLVSATDLYYAADLYFYVIAITDYDTGNEDELTTWFENALEVASADGVSTTIGDATFTLYSLEGQYWVDISKTE